MESNQRFLNSLIKPMNQMEHQMSVGSNSWVCHIVTQSQTQLLRGLALTEVALARASDT